MSNDDGAWYAIGAFITGAVSFVGIWWYCAAEYGFLGFALGWMPAAVLAAIIGLLWPLLVLAIACVVIYALIVKR